MKNENKKQLPTQKGLELLFVGPICTGIGYELSEGYYEVVANTILPDTDEEYENEKESIEGDMKHICNAINNTYGKGINPEAIEELLKAAKSCNREFDDPNDAEEAFKRLTEALKKAEL